MKNKIAEEQRKICCKHGSKYMPLLDNDLVAVATDTLGAMPINGMRYISKKNDNVSWYIYCGEFSNEADFFKPLHLSHLIDILPNVLPYLSLDEGYGFVIEYEDVWFEGFK